MIFRHVFVLVFLISLLFYGLPFLNADAQTTGLPPIDPPTIAQPQDEAIADNPVVRITGSYTTANCSPEQITIVILEDGAEISSVDVTTPGGTTACFPQTVSWGVDTPRLEEGFHAFSAVALDRAGNQSDPSDTVTILLDLAPPTIAAPPDRVFEATKRQTPLAGLDLGTPQVDDTADPNPVISNNAPTSFELGDTTVRWTATDWAEKTAAAIQIVTLVDTTEPELEVPSDIIIESSSSDRVVNYEEGVSAIDVVDGNLDVECNPQSGSIFSPGDTPVTCEATDSSGNTATASFVVSVRADFDPTWIIVAAVIVGGGVVAAKKFWPPSKPQPTKPDPDKQVKPSARLYFEVGIEDEKIIKEANARFSEQKDVVDDDRLPKIGDGMINTLSQSMGQVKEVLDTIKNTKEVVALCNEGQKSKDEFLSELANREFKRMLDHLAPIYSKFFISEISVNSKVQILEKTKEGERKVTSDIDIKLKPLRLFVEAQLIVGGVITKSAKIVFQLDTSVFIKKLEVKTTSENKVETDLKDIVAHLQLSLARISAVGFGLPVPLDQRKPIKLKKKDFKLSHITTRNRTATTDTR